MISPLVINIRCVCIEEFVKIKKIHETYRKQKIEGEITSAYVGADRKLYGLDKDLDKMLDKVYGADARPIVTERIVKEEPMSESEEEVFADVSPTLLTVNEAGAVGSGYAEMEETAFNPNAEDCCAKGEDWKVKEEPKPEITLTDVLIAMAEEPDPMEAINTEAEGESDGADWNTSAGR